jgi:hypothetical protein
MKLPKELKAYSAQELCDSGAIRFFSADIPVFVNKLQEFRLNKLIKENLHMQGLIIAANKIMTGEPWMRNQRKLDKLLHENNELTKLYLSLSNRKIT